MNLFNVSTYSHPDGERQTDHHPDQTTLQKKHRFKLTFSKYYYFQTVNILSLLTLTPNRCKMFTFMIVAMMIFVEDGTELKDIIFGQ